MPDGTKYVGEWQDGKYNGQGTLTYPDGQKYVGEFKDFLPDGKGVLFKVNGEIQSGIWSNGIIKDKWTIEAVNNYLKNIYPQFKGFDYETPTPSISR